MSFSITISSGFIFLWMVFNHIIDDYVLQAPCLSNLKQRDWWEKNCPDKRYEQDYKMALFMHSISWTFMIMLPIAICKVFNLSIWFGFFFCFNVLIHMFVDDLKANKKCISLVIDQTCHLCQIVFTYLFLVIMGC